MDNGCSYSVLEEETEDSKDAENEQMPSDEVETSYISSTGATTARSMVNSEPTIVINNPRANIGNKRVRQASDSPKKEHVRHSRRLPYWLWYLISKALGLKLTPNEKPICAIILYISTLVSALGYITSSVWYSAYDVIANHKGRSAQLEGTITILMTALWCALGIYANKLAYRLFGHRKFLDMLRLHSKTIFKLNAAFVVFFLWTAFIVLHNLGMFKFWVGTPCDKVSLTRVVCKLHFVSQAVFSFFALLWNILVAVVLVSVCRTHTISIRRFILDLEQDAMACDTRGETARQVASDYAFVEDDYFDDMSDESDGETNARRAANKTTESNNTLSTVLAQDSPSTSVHARGDSPNPSTATNVSAVMSNSEILHRYWSIMVKLRMSSFALQRWMVSVMALVIVWAAMNLVHWLSHDPQLYDVLNFIIPLLLLPLLCSAYSEVNNEGIRVTRSIKPLEERLQLLGYLLQFPLQLTVFNYPVVYSTIATVAIGFFFGLVSKMVIHEVTAD